MSARNSLDRDRRSPKSDPNQAPVAAATGSGIQRLCLIGVKVDSALKREIDEYAEAHGITRSRAAGEYLTIARDALRERDGIPAGRADDLLEALEGIRAVLDLLGPTALGTLRLLAHWAAQGGGVKVAEDELMTEIRSVGADEWEQTVADAERELHDAQPAPTQQQES
jgi:hypothetical protein